MFRWHVVSAVFWRNVKQYFSGPLGYLFIVGFVTVSAVMAFSPQFFAENQATLDQLSKWFPMLLLFFIPAITMSVWADEKRQGTDSILFTLPASDFDILLGKYLAVAAVYTVALMFSLTQVIVLNILGSPDWGVIATTYLGYWLAGLSLLAVGMFASSLTESATIAFVFGAILCAIPVLIGQYFRGFVGIERFGFDWNLRDFTLGLIPLANVVYFLSLTVFMLYLNLIVISKRHWNRGQQFSIGGQFLIRSIALAVALVSIGFLCNTAISSLWSRADLTSEKLYTLDQATVTTLEKVKKDDREVTIQAFISKDVPRKFVNAKKQFVGLLRQYSDYGGKNVSVRFVDVEPNTQTEIDAQQSGIEPEDDRSTIGGKVVEQKVYLGATVSTSLDDATLPFVSDDAAIEYELSRAVAATVDKSQQLTLGIVDTDARFGGPEFEGRRAEDQWCYSGTMSELNKQFKVTHVEPNQIADYLAQDPIVGEEAAEGNKRKKQKDAPGVMLVPDPSSLDDAAMASLVKYVEAGNPTILLTDPLPFFWTYQYPIPIGILNAPRQERITARSYAEILATSTLPKSDGGTASKILNAIGVDWDNGAAAWSNDNPHPGFQPTGPTGNRWSEYYGPREKAMVFIRNHGNTQCFNAEAKVSAGLKELLMFYPGSIRKSADSTLNFQPLVTLGKESGVTPWDRLTMTPVQPMRSINPRTGEITVENRPARSQITSGNLEVLNPQPQTFLDDLDHVVAARITGEGNNKVNVVVIADMDFLSDTFFQQQEALDKKLDNLTFLQNAIEVLAGNESFVALRNRRATPRTLEKLEAVIESYRAVGSKEQETAEKEMREELEKEQAKLSDATKEIQSNENMGFFEKLQRTSQEASDAQRRFDLKKRRLERKLKQKTAELDANKNLRITRLENMTRYFSILCAPLPAIVLGIVVLWFRKQNEERNIAPERKV
ncbi:MAG: Gldg family protein [Mariniblastus sp.]